MILVLIAIFIGGLLTVTLVLFHYSPGETQPFLDKNGQHLNGSISEKTFITVGGLKQGMIIKSKNKENPVLLYLHGGIPDYFLTQKYPTKFEEYFTVVWWDQRGSGLSYNTNIPEESVNLDQMIADTKDITNYLRSRFGQDKIYLMGHSGGTFIGIQVAANSPELYHAYIGIGQMTNQLQSERIAYEYLLKQYSDADDNKMVRKLEASPVTDIIPYKYLKLRDKAMHKIGVGTTHDMTSIVNEIFLPSLTFREYTLNEKLNFWRGKSKAGVHPLWNTMITTDLTENTTKINIPVYLFHGKYDYTVSYELAKTYFEVLKAPLKGFYTFENSAHSPHFEEPMRIKEIFINDIFEGKITMADKLEKTIIVN